MRDKRAGKEVKEKNACYILVIQGDEHSTWSRDSEIYARAYKQSWFNNLMRLNNKKIRIYHNDGGGGVLFSLCL